MTDKISRKSECWQGGDEMKVAFEVQLGRNGLIIKLKSTVSRFKIKNRSLKDTISVSYLAAAVGDDECSCRHRHSNHRIATPAQAIGHHDNRGPTLR
jgi:hypothetical protein